MSTLPEGNGHAEWVDALVVGYDAFDVAKKARPALKKAAARFVLISDLRAPIGKVDNLEDVLAALVAAFNQDEARWLAHHTRSRPCLAGDAWRRCVGVAFALKSAQGAVDWPNALSWVVYAFQRV